LRILITGGAGLNGPHVVEQCLDASNDVAVVKNFLEGKQDNLPTEVPPCRLGMVDIAAVQRVLL